MKDRPAVYGTFYTDEEEQAAFRAVKDFIHNGLYTKHADGPVVAVEGDYIVSFTTSPERAGFIGKTVQSLLNQVPAPKAVTVNLPVVFIRDGSHFSDIDVRTHDMERGAVRLNWTRDVGPGTKILGLLDVGQDLCLRRGAQEALLHGRIPKFVKLGDDLLLGNEYRKLGKSIFMAHRPTLKPLQHSYEYGLQQDALHKGANNHAASQNTGPNDGKQYLDGWKDLIKTRDNHLYHMAHYCATCNTSTAFHIAVAFAIAFFLFAVGLAVPLGICRHAALKRNNN